MDAVESVGRAAEHNPIDLIELHLGGIQGAFRRKPRKLFGCLQGAAHEPGHACAHNRYGTAAHKPTRISLFWSTI
jgi:hypothetical protein